MDRRLLWKTRFFLILVILTQPIGNLALTVGMKHRTLTSPLDYVLAIFSPYVALGIVFLVVWLLSRMALLSWADMSYVLPITAIGYIANALLGRFVLQEQVSATRWMGTVLIAVGTLLVSLTPARTPSVR
jgi:uncharacterized membrane protein